MTGRRAVILLLCTLTGMCVGLMGDHLAHGGALPPVDVLSALILSPLAVTFGGKAVTLTRFSNVFLVGGLLFWPVYVLLSWLWLKRGTPWVWLAILLWCSQGFFQVVHRFWLLMSA
jgi:hypothetical protein